MSAGHLAMAFDRSFLLALLLLVVGSGFLKGNISAQVGALYPLNDEARRTRGFAIFSMAINFGAVAGPLVCGFLAQRLRLARRLRRRRGLHAGWTGDLSLWLSPSAGARASVGERDTRRLTARGVANHLRARGGDADHDLPVGLLLPARQRPAGLDPGARRPRRGRLSRFRSPGTSRSMRSSASSACRCSLDLGIPGRRGAASRATWRRSARVHGSPRRAT